MPRPRISPRYLDTCVSAGDNVMLGVYIAGSFYTGLEIIAHALKSAGPLYGQISPIFFPVWNMIDAVGVVLDGAKDAKNGDEVSAYINYFSGLQLTTGTTLGLLATQEVVTTISASAGATMSSAAFALCMYCSAAVAFYKSFQLQQAIKVASNPTATSEEMSRIIDKVSARNSAHTPALEEIKRHFLNGNRVEKLTAKSQIVSILKAEHEYQCQARKAWFMCGVAMTVVAVAVAWNPPALAVIIVAALTLSVAYRISLKLAEKKMEKKIADALVAPSATRKPVIIAASTRTTEATINAANDSLLVRRRAWTL